MTAPASLPGKSMVRRKNTAPRHCRQTQAVRYWQVPRQTFRPIRQTKQMQKQNLPQHLCLLNRTFASYRRLQKC